MARSTRLSAVNQRFSMRYMVGFIATFMPWSRTVIMARIGMAGNFLAPVRMDGKEHSTHTANNDRVGSGCAVVGRRSVSDRSGICLQLWRPLHREMGRYASSDRAPVRQHVLHAVRGEWHPKSEPDLRWAKHLNTGWRQLRTVNCRNGRAHSGTWRNAVADRVYLWKLCACACTDERVAQPRYDLCRTAHFDSGTIGQRP